MGVGAGNKIRSCNVSVSHNCRHVRLPFWDLLQHVVGRVRPGGTHETWRVRVERHGGRTGKTTETKEEDDGWTRGGGSE